MLENFCEGKAEQLSEKNIVNTRFCRFKDYDTLFQQTNQQTEMPIYIQTGGMTDSIYYSIN